MVKLGTRLVNTSNNDPCVITLEPSHLSCKFKMMSEPSDLGNESCDLSHELCYQIHHSCTLAHNSCDLTKLFD